MNGGVNIGSAAVAARRGVLAAALALCLAFGLHSSVAANLETVSVDRVDGRFVLHSETLLDATPAQLYAVLTDYDLFTKFTSAIDESRNVEPDDEGRPRFYTRMEGCVLLFCVTFERHGHLELEPETLITAIVDPEQSDFKYSVETWELIKHEEGTRLVYNFEMEPDFWVPPIVGPFYIRRALRAGAVDAVDRIEALAQGVEPRT